MNTRSRSRHSGLSENDTVTGRHFSQGARTGVFSEESTATPSKCSSGYYAKNTSFCCSDGERSNKSPPQKSYQHLKELLGRRVLIREAVRRVLESRSFRHDPERSSVSPEFSTARRRRPTKTWCFDDYFLVPLSLNYLPILDGSFLTGLIAILTFWQG